MTYREAGGALVARQPSSWKVRVQTLGAMKDIHEC